MDDSSDYLRRLRSEERLTDATQRFRWAMDGLRRAFEHQDSENLERLLQSAQGIHDELVKLARALAERAAAAERNESRMRLWAIIGGLAGGVGAIAAIATIVIALT